MTRRFKGLVAITMAVLLCGAIALPAQADQRGQARSSVNQNKNVNKNTNVNRNTNVNTNVNRNTNVNVDRRRDVDIDIDVDHRHGGCCYHPVATVAAVAVTAAVVGSIVYSLPPSCTVIMANGIAYQQCGSVWYQPQFVGTSTTYVVVNQPRY
jgi:hypothetical protein